MLDTHDKVIKILAWIIPGIVTLALVATISALYVTSRDVPGTLLNLVSMMIAYWIGIIAPSPVAIVGKRNE